MDKEIKNVKRRQILKGIALGGGAIVAASFPEEWIKPVVDAIIIPAHAQTSPIPEDPADPTPPTPPCEADSITAESTFTDGILRSIGIFDSGGTNLGNACCESPLSVTVSALPPGTYTVSMGINTGTPTATTLNISTDCGTCSITQDIAGGAPDGSGTNMAEITLPAGTCVEL